jgi:predicted 2-oxoglutarate/Fe(II)-dependent dioxygenase YbiX
MKIKYQKVKGHPVIIIDSFYTDTEYDSMLEECTTILSANVLLDPEETEGATAVDGTLLKKNKAIFIDDLYSNRRKDSNILNANRKIFSNRIHEVLMSYNSFFYFIKYSNRDTTLYSYYEDSGHYSNHRDSAYLTTLTWLYTEPKTFSGGDFIVEDQLKIKCLANRTVFMPSYLLHKVEPVVMEKQHLNKGLGRMTISHFIR